nr:hypothetical protein [Candidatus Sigynarchaeum springense]
MDLLCVVGIVGCVKIVSNLNQLAPRARFIQTPVASTQAAAATGSKGNFSSACVDANEPGSKLCKKCGAAV